MAKKITALKSRKFNYGERVPYDTGMMKLITLMQRYFEKISLYFFGGEDRVTVFQGLEVTHNTARTVTVADGILAIPNDLTESTQLHFAVNLETNLNVPAADTVNDRIDIVQARYKKVPAQTENIFVLNSGVNDPVQVNETVRNLHTIELSVKSGTPAPTPSAPTPDVGYDAFIMSSQDWSVVTTVDLSEKYMIRLQIDDEPAKEIDLRGGNPAATTLAEIVAKINTVIGGDPAASGAGDLLTISAREGKFVGEVRMTPPPLTPSGMNVDATAILFGQYYDAMPLTVLKTHVQSNYYEIIAVGVDDAFAIAEISVLANETNLVPARIRDIYQKNLWESTAAADLIRAGFFGYIDHRNAPDLDHPDGSVKANHLDPSLLASAILKRFSRYRKKRIVGDEVDAGNNLKRKFTIVDMQLTNGDGTTNLNIFGGNYAHGPNALAKFGAGQFNFVHNTVISVPTNYGPSCEQEFQFASDPDGLNRTKFWINQIVVYCNTKGVSTNNLFVRIIKSSDNSLQVETQIPVASLTNGEYVVIPIPPTELDAAVNYKMQFKQAAPTFVLSAAAAATLNYRAYFRPEAGEYQNTAEPTNNGMSLYIWDRELEVVVEQIKGYAANLSDAALWNVNTPNVFPYIEPEKVVGDGVDYLYAAVDTIRGRIKIPEGLKTNYLDGFPEREIRCDFNAQIFYDNLDNDNLPTDSKPTGNKGLQTFIDDYLYAFIPYLKELTAGAVDFSRHNVQRITTNANVNITITGTQKGAIYVLMIKNSHASTSVTLTWPVSIKWPDDTVVGTVSAQKTLQVTLTFDGVNYFATSAGEYDA